MSSKIDWLVYNATFRGGQLLLLEEARVPRENHTP